MAAVGRAPHSYHHTLFRLSKKCRGTGRSQSFSGFQGFTNAWRKASSHLPFLLIQEIWGNRSLWKVPLLKTKTPAQIWWLRVTWKYNSVSAWKKDSFGKPSYRAIMDNPVNPSPGPGKSRENSSSRVHCKTKSQAQSPSLSAAAPQWSSSARTHAEVTVTPRSNWAIVLKDPGWTTRGRNAPQVPAVATPLRH